MANTFGNLVTQLPVMLDTVLREQIGYIPAVWINGEAAQAAVGQTINYPLVPEMEVVDASADCCDVPCAGDQNWDSAQMVIDHDRAVRFCWTGEEDLAINNSYNGTGGNGMRDMQVQEAIRMLVNEVELSIAQVAYNAANTYVPVSNGELFSNQADNIKDLTNLRKILNRNAVPDNDRHLVMGFDAAANVRNLYNITRANENNSDLTLRTGRMLSMLNFDLHESFAADDDVNGSAATGYLVNGAANQGSKTLVIDTGTGTISPGSSFTLAGGTESYYVVSRTGNTLNLAQGLQRNIADNVALTFDANGYGAQLAFHRRAIVLATRTPRIIGGQDRARNRAYVTDPVSGMTFMVSEYDGYRATNYELSLVWGVKMVKPEMAVLIGR